MSDSSLSRKFAAAITALILGVALSACSSGGDDVADLGGGSDTAQTEDPATTADSGGGTDEEPADATVVSVSAFEFGYELVTPTTAGTYVFELTNDGSGQHDLVIEGGTASGGTSIISAGDMDSFTVTLEPGEYTLFCSVGNHRAQGMEVTFTVN